MRQSLLWAAIFLGAGACLAGDPVVSSVRAQQRGDDSKLVDIWYDVADTDGDRLAVSVTLTDNGASVPAASVTGDVGAGVAPGVGKRIVWDAGADWSGHLSENVRASVTADDGRTVFYMVRSPGGTNSGTDPDYGEYSLTVETFFMDATEVTKEQWDAMYTWAITHGYNFANVGSGKAAKHPVHTVDWYDCVKWCNARSEKEGLTPCYTVGGNVYRRGLSAPDCNFAVNGYRLPTNTEWTYAARGGASGRRFPWGDTITHSHANYCSDGTYYWNTYDVSSTRGYHPTYATDVPYTSPVGAFASNGYGLYDMVGNVYEWCNDSSGSDRPVRGGCWRFSAHGARCGTISFWYTLGSDGDTIGFRAVCR